MKFKALNLFTGILILFLVKSCVKKEVVKLEIAPKYAVSVSQTNNTNAPALQSFTHAESISGKEWLLFAGRTNSLDSLNGGIHNLNGNYAGSSFTQSSYNDVIYVYNPKKDEISGSLTIADFIKLIEEKIESSSAKNPSILSPYYGLLKVTKKNTSIFKNSNALVKQDGNYLYTLGGYGPADFSNPKKGFITYNHVAKINVSNLIKLVKEKALTNKEWLDLMKVGKNDKLISTGGELYKYGEILYLSAGHNFGNTAPNEGQKYVDAIYPFTLKNNKDNKFALDITTNTPISDVSAPSNNGSDTTSVFRRRDGPILPSLYKNPINKSIEKSIAIYAGVFKPGHPLKAWKDAIYVHPNWANSESKLYTYDTAYDQENYNVYSCPSFVLFDSKSNKLHSYLIGGIGDGKGAPKGHLSGFTNTSVHIEMNVDKYPLKSTKQVLNYNIFTNAKENNKPYYGAEAILFPNRNLSYSKYSEEIIDINSTFSDQQKTIEIGYIFGGIEAFESNPGTYGPKKSQASNKIWKVTLTQQF
ncbi:MAG: hypothetical protein V3V28_01430 [Polaribacter sp.]|uniref:hypothetical protein n=1 Tax=Polaribacter sp. TaxID=1920175 RepID=UPI002F35B634